MFIFFIFLTLCNIHVSSIAPPIGQANGKNALLQKVLEQRVMDEKYTQAWRNSYSDFSNKLYDQDDDDDVEPRPMHMMQLEEEQGHSQLSTESATMPMTMNQIILLIICICIILLNAFAVLAMICCLNKFMDYWTHDHFL